MVCMCVHLHTASRRACELMCTLPVWLYLFKGLCEECMCTLMHVYEHEL